MSSASEAKREEMITAYLCLLEHDDPLTRMCACRALALLRVREMICINLHKSINFQADAAVSALSYMAGRDVSENVRRACNHALAALTRVNYNNVPSRRSTDRETRTQVKL